MLCPSRLRSTCPPSRKYPAQAGIARLTPGFLSRHLDESYAVVADARAVHLRGPCIGLYRPGEPSAGADNQGMPTTGQARDPERVLSMFLDARLPQRDAVARAWARQAEAAPWSGIETDPDCRRQSGSAAEIRIGPGVALTPGCWDVLSFLPPEECRALLSAAGYSADGREDLADTGTTDPLLLDWRRVSHPIACGDDQQAVPTGCWDAAGMRRSRTE